MTNLTKDELIGKLVEALNYWCPKIAPDLKFCNDKVIIRHAEKWAEARNILHLAASQPADVSEGDCKSCDGFTYVINGNKAYKCETCQSPAQPKATTAEREAALEWLERNFLEDEDSRLEDIFSIGTPPGTDYSQIYLAMNFIKIIRAALTDQAPEGFVLVPIEPTEEMLGARSKTSYGDAYTDYKAMIAARPNKEKQ